MCEIKQKRLAKEARACIDRIEFLLASVSAKLEAGKLAKAA